jgi:hypothetical protein
VKCKAKVWQVAGSAVTIILMTGMTMPVWADGSPGFQVTVGVKGWENQWNSWSPVTNSQSGVTAIQSVNSGYHFAVIPQASIRYGRWQLSGSYFVKTTYALTGRVNPANGALEPLSGSREEFDGTLGYYLFPSLAIIAGYKQIEQDFGPNTYKWTGPTVGLSGSASLHSHLAIYGTFIEGFPTLNANSADDAGRKSFEANYSLGEFGLAYAFPVAEHSSVTLTLGFRAQIMVTNNFATATGHGGYTVVDVHDITQGPTFGILGRY